MSSPAIAVFAQMREPQKKPAIAKPSFPLKPFPKISHNKAQIIPIPIHPLILSKVHKTGCFSIFFLKSSSSLGFFTPIA
jgi:hypothetical protein